MLYLLDTDHVSILQWKSGVECIHLNRRLMMVPASDVGVSIVSFHEQALGSKSYLSRAKDGADLVKGYERWTTILEDFANSSVVAFDASVAWHFDQLKAQNIRVATMDLRIAATANNLTLLTRNTVDFARVPGLKFEDWTI